VPEPRDPRTLSDSGQTRILAAMTPQEVWDYDQGGYRPAVDARPSCGPTLGAWDPWTAGLQTVVSDSCSGGEWESKRQHEARQRDPARRPGEDFYDWGRRLTALRENAKRGGDDEKG